MAYFLVAFIFLALGVLVGASTKRSAEHIQNREIDCLREFLNHAGPDALEIRYEPDFDSLLSAQLNTMLDAVAEEYALVERRAQEWERAADSIDDSMCIIDQRGRVVRANAALADRIGVDVRQTRGMDLAPLLIAEDANATSPIDLARRTGRLAKGKIERCALGQDLDLLAQPVDGSSTALLLVIRDQDQGVCARRHRRLSRLVDTVPVSVLTADAMTGAIDFANAAFLAQFGYDRSELKTLRIDDLTARDDESARLTLRTVAHDDQAGAVLLALLNADGDLVFTRVFGSVLRTPNGKADDLLLVLEKVEDAAVVRTKTADQIPCRPSVVVAPPEPSAPVPTVEAVA